MQPAAPAASFVLAFALLGAASPSGATASCSNDTFTIDGSAVAVQVCLTAAAPPVPAHKGGAAKAAQPSLSETFTAKGQAPLVRVLPLDAPPGDEASRTIDDVGLEKIGLARTLHLTIEVRAGGARLEHALLVPGAVTLK